jgi:hypothetical protein
MNVDKEFDKAVMFLTMAIDRFRNEKSHTADSKIDDPVRAYEYLRLNSLALHLLDGAKVLTELVRTMGETHPAATVAALLTLGGAGS